MNTPTPSSPRKPAVSNLFTIRLAMLPSHLRTIKSLFPLLAKIDVNIHNVTTLRTGMVLVRSADPHLAIKMRKIRELAREPTIQIVGLDNTPRTPYSHKLSYSCVVTGVDHDISIEEIEHRLEELNLPFKKVWRIRSRRTEQETRLIRIVTEDKSTVDQLLQNGFSIFFHIHRVEFSHPTFIHIGCHNAIYAGAANSNRRQTMV